MEEQKTGKMKGLQNGELAIIPTNITEVKKYVESIKGSVCVPNSFKNPQDIFGIIVMGQEMGVPPMAAIQNMTVIRGKIGMYSDFMMALVRNHPEYAGCSYEVLTKDGKFFGYSATMKRTMNRNGNSFVDEVTLSFTMHDVRMRGMDKQNPLYNTMPKVMCKHRIDGMVSKALFNDVLQGVYTREEIAEMEANNPEPEVIKEGEDFEVVENPELEIAIEEAEIVEDMSTVKKDISDNYKKLILLFPDEWDNDYIREHNEKFLGVKDAKKCADIEQLKLLLTDLESRIAKIEQEV